MSPLANQNPLAQLNDISTLTAPNWFPPALIYWLILFASIMLVFVIYYFLKKNLEHKKQQKSYLNKLQQLQHKQADFITLNILLKGCALNYFSRENVASLHGESWFHFLQQYASFSLFKDKHTFIRRLYTEQSSRCDDQDFCDAKRWITELPNQIKKHNHKQETKDV